MATSTPSGPAFAIPKGGCPAAPLKTSSPRASPTYSPEADERELMSVLRRRARRPRDEIRRSLLDAFDGAASNSNPSDPL